MPPRGANCTVYSTLSQDQYWRICSAVNCKDWPATCQNGRQQKRFFRLSTCEHGCHKNRFYLPPLRTLLQQETVLRAYFHSPTWRHQKTGFTGMSFANISASGTGSSSQQCSNMAATRTRYNGLPCANTWLPQERTLIACKKNRFYRARHVPQELVPPYTNRSPL